MCAICKNGNQEDRRSLCMRSLVCSCSTAGSLAGPEAPCLVCHGHGQGGCCPSHTSTAHLGHLLFPPVPWHMHGCAGVIHPSGLFPSIHPSVTCAHTACPKYQVCIYSLHCALHLSLVSTVPHLCIVPSNSHSSPHAPPVSSHTVQGRIVPMSAFNADSSRQLHSGAAFRLQSPDSGHPKHAAPLGKAGKRLAGGAGAVVGGVLLCVHTRAAVPGRCCAEW